MYPYLNIFGIQIPSLGLGVVVATLAFIYFVYRYSKKLNLKFAMFFNFLPVFLILPYLLGRYFYDLLEYHFFFPTDLLSLVSPYNYRFSFIGITIGFGIAVIVYLLKLKYSQEKKKWLDVIFYSVSLALVIIGPFLLLSDTFYGIATSSSWGVHILTTNTQIPYPNSAFYPVGIFVSFLGLFLYLLGKILHFIFKKPGITLYLIPLFFVGFWGIFHFQYYPKHFLFGIDVKQLYCILGAIFAPIVLYFVMEIRKFTR